MSIKTMQLKLLKQLLIFDNDFTVLADEDQFTVSKGAIVVTITDSEIALNDGARLVFSFIFAGEVTDDEYERMIDALFGKLSELV